MIRALLPRLVRGERLTREGTGAAVRAMMRGEVADAQIAAFLFALAQRGESAEELLGDAQRDGFEDATRQAESIHKQSLSARNRLKLLREKKQ